MYPPVSTTTDDHRKRREEAIIKNLTQISNQQRITQQKDFKSLQRLVSDAVEEVKWYGKELDERRATRNLFSKGGNGLQKLTSSLSMFLKAYPGISDLSKGADCQYGGMVIGALSLLFQIGENKEGRETAISSAFAELTKPWIGPKGRLKKYSEALPASAEMDAFVADVYLGIGELAVDSLRYYLRPPWVRFWQAIRRPPKLGIDLKVNEIKKALDEVVREGEAQLLHSHFQQVGIAEERGKIAETQGQRLIKESELTNKWREQERRNKIDPIVRRLGIDWDTVGPQSSIRMCKLLHAPAFAESVRRKRSKKLQQMNLDLVKTSAFYKSWHEAIKSSVLILSGSNFDMYEAGLFLCWLSPITTEFAETQLSNQMSLKQSRVLFFSACRDEASRYGKKKELLTDCFSHFISQILHWDTEFVDQNSQSVEDDVKDLTRQRKDILQRLLRACKCFDQIYIIIDRLDCIAPLSADDESDEDAVSGNLAALLDTVCVAACNVKLMITIDANEWSEVKNDADMESRWKIWEKQIELKDYSMHCKIGWTQPEAQSW